MSPDWWEETLGSTPQLVQTSVETPSSGKIQFTRKNPPPRSSMNDKD
jgi:hypothetical protein